MQVSAVIPNWNGLHYLRPLFESIAGQPFHEIIVVDNGSSDNSAAWAASQGARVISFESNRGFAAAVNEGVKAANGEAVAILNNDVRLHPEWLRHLTRALTPDCAAACGKILSARNPERIDAAWDALSFAATALRCGNGRPDGDFWNRTRTVQFVPLTAALVRTDVFQQVGGLDELFESYLEDTEFGLRCAARGYHARYVPDAIAWHVGSGTLGEWSPRTVRQIARNQLYLVARHYPSATLRQLTWRMLVGQLLWGAVAAKNFRFLVWLSGKIEGLRNFRAVRRAGWSGITEVLADSERTIHQVQAETGFDLYWRLYFSLTRW
jgi:GT2 family glycosyltransferase